MGFTLTTSNHLHTITLDQRFIGCVEKRTWNQTIDALGSEPHLIIDLSATTFMDSTGIGLLIGTVKTVRARGGEVVLVGLQTRTKALLRMTHLLDEVFVHLPHQQAAERHFMSDSVA